MSGGCKEPSNQAGSGAEMENHHLCVLKANFPQPSDCCHAASFSLSFDFASKLGLIQSFTQQIFIESLPCGWQYSPCQEYNDGQCRYGVCPHSYTAQRHTGITKQGIISWYGKCRVNTNSYSKGIYLERASNSSLNSLCGTNLFKMIKKVTWRK